MKNYLTISMLLAAATLAVTSPSLAQNHPTSTTPPTPHGSLDAITVLPATPPATPHAPATQPSQGPNPTAIPGHPMKQQGPATGAIRLHIDKGLDTVTSLTNDPLRIDLFARGKILKTFHDTVPENGILELHDLPLDDPFQTVITVTHGGADQQIVGPPQHRYQPNVEFQIKVYETTAEKPDWTIGLRYIAAVPVRVEPTTPGEPAGVYLQVSETIGLFNPLDRAWTGELVDGERQTLAVTLPTNISDLQMGQGFAEASAKVKNNTLIRPRPMPPGPTQYIFGYRVPVADGKAALSFTAPANTTLFALYLPPDVKIDNAPGLDKGNAAGMQGEERRQILKARTVKTGQTLTVALSGIVPPKPPETLPAEMTDQKSDINLRPPPANTPGK